MLCIVVKLCKIAIDLFYKYAFEEKATRAISIEETSSV